MTEDMDGAAARDEVARLLREAAATQVVAEAEEAVCTAWTHHLNRLVDTTRQEVDAARRVCHAAHDLLREARRCDDPGGLQTAQSVLAIAEANQRQTVSQARQVLVAIHGEIATVAAAERNREAAARLNALRVAALRGGHGPSRS